MSSYRSAWLKLGLLGLMGGLLAVSGIRAGGVPPTAKCVTLDPALAAVDPNGKTLWYDGRLLLLEGQGWTNTESYYDRLPARAKDTAGNIRWFRSHDSAGLCLRFGVERTKTNEPMDYSQPVIQVRWVLNSDVLAMPNMAASGVSGVDLYGRIPQGPWRHLSSARPRTLSTLTNQSALARANYQEYLLYLPLYNGVRLVQVGLDKTLRITKPTNDSRLRRKPIVFYGTSISQGGCASRPGMAATALVGRNLDVPIINLGFNASGQMVPEMAELLKELDPAVYVLECYTNMKQKMLNEEVIGGFVKILRKARPTTPILIVGGTSCHSERVPGTRCRMCQRSGPYSKTSCHIERFPGPRKLSAIYAKLEAQGITGLHYLPSVDLLGEDGEGTVDGCHPNDVGMMRQAAGYTQALTPLLDSTPALRASTNGPSARRP